MLSGQMWHVSFPERVHWLRSQVSDVSFIVLIEASEWSSLNSWCWNKDTTKEVIFTSWWWSVLFIYSPSWFEKKRNHMYLMNAHGVWTVKSVILLIWGHRPACDPNPPQDVSWGAARPAPSHLSVTVTTRDNMQTCRRRCRHLARGLDNHGLSAFVSAWWRGHVLLKV